MSIIVDRAKSKDLNHLGFAFGFLLSYKRQLVIASVALLFTSAITLGLGQGLRMMVDEGFYSGQLEHLTRTALIFVGLALLLGLGTFIRHYYVSWLGERTVADLRQHVFSRLIYLDPGFFEHNLSGEIQTRITTDTTIIQNVIGSSASVALRNSLTLIGGAAMMILTDWKLSLIILICVPLMIGPILLLGRGVRRYSLTTQDRMAKLGAFVGESIGHIKTVQAFNHQSHDIQSFTEVVESTFAAAKTRIVYRSFLIAMVMSGLLIAIAGILWVGGMDVINNRISIGQLVAFGFYAFLVAMSLASISEIFSELQKAAGATQRLCELATAKSTLHLPQNPVAIPTQCRGQLTFSNLHFAYPARPDYHAINNLQLEIQPGESLALVGPSGAGKTTLFDLILRYYDPLQGDILLDGASIRDLKLEDLRNLIAIVPQEPALFTTSVLENIRYSKPRASREEVKAAAHAAYASDFIAELPEGYDTFLGEKGARLSGGQNV